MARIKHSELAPEGAVRYSLANVSFEIGEDSADFETNDPLVLSNAEAHPWLEVERDEAEQIRGEYVDPSVAPEDDALSAQNSVAFDADEIRKVEESKHSVESDRTAVEAGLDQDEVVEGPRNIDFTLAADQQDDNPEDNEL